MKVALLGNGPSLWDVDLKTLPEEWIVIACNRIHQHWSFEDGWRPDVWVFGDLYGNKSFKSEVELHVTGGYDCWIKSDILVRVLNEKMEPSERFWWPDYANVFPYQNCFHRRDMNMPVKWHPPHICNFTGAINAMAQIAVWHYGAGEVYFLGVDGKMKEGINGNHFREGYQEVWYGPPLVERINTELQIGHTIIAKELRSAGVPAYNLTPDSAFSQHTKAVLEEIVAYAT